MTNQSTREVSASSPIRILHLSDLHFAADADPMTSLTWLLQDLRGLEWTLLDRGVQGSPQPVTVLVVSGDLADRGNEIGLAHAKRFLQQLLAELNIPTDRCVIVPGNHDVCDHNDYYTFQRQSPPPGSVSFQEGGMFFLPNERFNERFKPFAEVFEEICGRPYPLPPAEQGLAFLLPDLGLQFLTLNTAHALGQFKRKGASAFPPAVAQLIATADRQVIDARNSGQLSNGATPMQIGIWHHAVTGPEQIADQSFREHLRRAGVLFCLTGDVHEIERDTLHYWDPTRIMHVFGTGSFGARPMERPEGAPCHYSLLELRRQDRTVRVHTRRQLRLNAPWSPWREWPHPAVADASVGYFDVALGPVTGRQSPADTVSVVEEDAQVNLASVPSLAALTTLDEDTLRDRLVAPLLMNIGFRDVQTRQDRIGVGAELVAWGSGTAGLREYLAVIVRSVPLAGFDMRNAGSVNGVIAQIFRCFGEAVTDAAIGALNKIDNCWVIINKNIAPDAEGAILAALRGGPYEGKVKLVDGVQLWKLLQSSSLATFVQDVSQVAARGSTLDSHYVVDVETHLGQVTYVINERFPGAFDERPLTFHIDDSPGRDEVLDALRRVHNTGTAVQLTGEAARSLRLADEFRHLAVPLSSMESVTIGPPSPTASYLVRLVVDDGRNEPLAFDNVAVDLIQVGPGEGRITNQRQPYPLLLRFDIRLGTGAVEGTASPNVTLHYEPASRNVAELHSYNLFAAMLRRRCTLRLIDRTTHQRILEVISTSAPSSGGDPQTLAFLSDLIRLQDWCGFALTIPSEPTEEEIATLTRLSSIVRTGKVGGTWRQLEITATITDREAFAAMLTGESRPLRFAGDGVEQLGSLAIPLGPTEITYESARLTDPKSVSSELDANTGAIKLVFIPGETNSFERKFLQWPPVSANPRSQRRGRSGSRKRTR